MKRIHSISLFCILFLLSMNMGLSQNGITFSEFSAKLENYFDKEMIGDIKKQIPQNIKFTVWGWDVGDFSGDRNPDLAFSLKVLQEKRKIAYVYLFVDIDGFLELVYQQPFEFFELPLEIGVSIRNNICSITQKKKNDFWKIVGFTFDNGIISLVNDYTSEKIEDYYLERQIDYRRTEQRFKLVPLGGSSKTFETDFLFVPSYPRGIEITKGYPLFVYAGKTDYVVKGSYYWKGERDASMEIRSSYDSEYLYFIFDIVDDVFIPKLCDKCISDGITLWFDFTPFKDSFERVLRRSGRKILPRENTSENLFQIEIVPGNFIDILPFVKSVLADETLDEIQKQSIAKIKIVTNPTDSGFVLKLRLPFSLFGYETCPVEDSEPIHIGFTAIYKDIDNEFRPEEETWLTTSVFEPNVPSSFGELILIPDAKNFCFTRNIYLESILKSLEDFGF